MPRPRVGSRVFSWLALAVACGCSVAAEPLAPLPEAWTPPTRYDALVATLPQADEDTRRRFADLALGALIDAYAVELGGGRAAAAAPVWQRGTRGFVAGLVRTRERLRRGAPLDIVREGRHAVRLIVGDEQVMVSAARPSAQATLEAGIAAAACDAGPCAAAAAPSLDESVAVRERTLRGEWTLADREPPMYTQEDGLHCAFEDMRHLRLKQAACEALTRELRLLEEALRAVLQHGGHVDWQVLRVGPGTESGSPGRRRVSYDASGRYFDLDLPLLGAAPDVVRGALPWLQTRLRGQPAQYVITAPERLAYRVPDTGS